MRLLKERKKAEDIVQEVIIEYWKHSNKNSIQNLKNYLHRSVYFRAINYIKKEKKLSFSELTPLNDPVDDSNVLHDINYRDTKSKIDRAIDQLPEKCRVIFILSRFENKSYKEIATELDISVRTVENQISIALKQLRKKILKKM